jgi:uncharacterized membrane protein
MDGSLIGHAFAFLSGLDSALGSDIRLSQSLCYLNGFLLIWLSMSYVGAVKHDLPITKAFINGSYVIFTAGLFFASTYPEVSNAMKAVMWADMMKLGALAGVASHAMRLPFAKKQIEATTKRSQKPRR